MNDFNLASVAITETTISAARSSDKVTRLFLRGPIPLEWLAKAGRLPGRCLHVGIVIWFLIGVENEKRVKLSPQRLRQFGVSRHSTYRALRLLEQHGLLRVERRRGASPIVETRGT